jgi:hypothetical protein
MTQPTNTFDSFDAIGNREDLSDMIWMVSPEKTPFISSIGKVSATATNHEWQTDALAAAAANAHVEGDDSTGTALSPTVRLGNYTQIMKKVAVVTGTQRANASAGRGDEMDYQVAKLMKELKTDMEKAALDNNAKVLGNSTTAREMAGVESWIATNTSAGATGADPTGDGTDARTDGTARPFAEADLKTVLAACADAGGDPDMISVGSFNKQAISAFSGNGTRTTDGDKQKLNTAVHIYISDFGELVVEYNQFQRAKSALVLDTSMWKLAELRGLSTTDLAKTGDTDKRQLLWEGTLEACNEKSSGIVADLSVS